MGAVPYGGVELEVGVDPGVVIRVLKVPVTLQQSLEPHEVGKLAGFGCLAGSFFFKKDSHVINLDDLLRVYLRNLQPPSYPLKETLMLEAGQRLPDRSPGDAEALSKCRFANSCAGLMNSGQDFATQGQEDGFAIHA